MKRGIHVKMKLIIWSLRVSAPIGEESLFGAGLNLVAVGHGRIPEFGLLTSP